MMMKMKMIMMIWYMHWRGTLTVVCLGSV